MSIFSYKDIYVEEDGRRILEMNILPEKYCNFDCVTCPLGRATKVDMPQSFDEMGSSLNELENVLEKSKVDLVYINSKGETLVNDKVIDVINLIRSKKVLVRLHSNGYLLGRDEYMKIADMCDETVGCLSVISEEDFQKLKRPIGGYTIENHIFNMHSFCKQYKGKFLLKVTILKGYNDTEETVKSTKSIIDKISPDKIIVEGIRHDKFKPAFGISEDRLKEISNILLGIK